MLAEAERSLCCRCTGGCEGLDSFQERLARPSDHAQPGPERRISVARLLQGNDSPNSMQVPGEQPWPLQAPDLQPDLTHQVLSFVIRTSLKCQERCRLCVSCADPEAQFLLHADQDEACLCQLSSDAPG